MYWYEKEAKVFSPVISTRVRFARNLEEIPFPRMLSEDARIKVWERVCRAYQDRGAKPLSFDSLGALEKNSLVETRLASPALAKAGKGAGLILSPEGDISIMVGEEDHIRLQAIYPGKAVAEAFDAATDWIRYGEERLPFAFREHLGYLTACPTNLGAACRISAMIHLPALTELGAMQELIRNLNNVGFTVRGAFGEGSSAQAGIYQISNHLSREKTPDQIRDAFEAVLSDIEERERTAAQTLYAKTKDDLEDRIGRAIGTVKYSGKMSYGEFTRLYSLIRFGKALGLKEARETKLSDRLLIELMPAPMVLSHAQYADEKTRDLARSSLLRKITRQ